MVRLVMWSLLILTLGCKSVRNVLTFNDNQVLYIISRYVNSSIVFSEIHNLIMLYFPTLVSASNYLHGHILYFSLQFFIFFLSIVVLMVTLDQVIIRNIFKMIQMIKCKFYFMYLLGYFLSPVFVDA